MKNKRPKLWCGRPFNFGLYKHGKLCITQHDVGVNSQAVFNSRESVLYFGVASQMAPGAVFQNYSITSSNYRADLSKFPSGMIISLAKDICSGEYRFSARAATIVISGNELSAS